MTQRGDARSRRRLALCIAGAALLFQAPFLQSQNTPADRAGGPASILTREDVSAVLLIAATALGDDTLSAAVVDRTGSIVGVYARPGAGARTPDIAVSLARTAAMFANDQAPLSSRTVRFISGIHFPPGVRNTPNAALYGVENINRGCKVDDAGDAIFNAPFPRPTSIAGAFGSGAGVAPLPCEPSDTRGCARGGPMLDLDGRPVESVGITTGKADVLDSGQQHPATVPVNPGGMPIYRDGKVVGGVGVAGVRPEFAEYAATAAAAGAGRGLDFSEPLGAPGAVFIDGLRLPFFGGCANIPCIRRTLRSRPAGSAPGLFSSGRFVVQPRDGLQAPEGYLVGPRASARAGGLTETDVRQIVARAVEVSLRTRAMIRLPFNSPARMTIGISDEAGDILALYRMADGTVFSSDVAMTKARNAYYFSTREGYDVLRQYAETNPHERYRWEPEPPAGQGWAVTARTLSFGGQPLFPPGVDLPGPLHGDAPTPGPFFHLYVYDTLHACTEGPGPSRGGNRAYLNQSGIVWFPGSVPLYRGGRLIGGMGVSGDGVEQDDYVSLLGSEGFHPPDALRVDNSVMRDSQGRAVRLPYLKLPRVPDIPRR
ncbi:MAG TPA: heme-binding protein [Vicinamibacterales bacterium]|nr:heme-binding protein [Vicinamibacterales bacterium]